MVAAGETDNGLHFRVLAQLEAVERLVTNWKVHGKTDVKPIKFSKLKKVSEYLAKTLI